MKRILALVLVLVMLCSCFAGCGEQIEKQIESLNEIVTSKKVETDTAKYIVTIKIKQVHYSLDFTEHLKDELNEVSIQIPVDKEFYDTVAVGDVIDDSFRMGSLLAKGSAGKWKITVENKEIQ